MKKLFTFIFILSFVGVQAQQVCCSSTALFADMGEQDAFQSAHQVPAATTELEIAGEWITLSVADGESARAFLASSAREQSNTYLFVFHEWWGLNEHIQAEATQWAKALPDVHVLAIDLYDGKNATTREAASELMQNADEKRIRSIISGAIAFAGDDAEVATIGWCFGGGWSMQAAIMLGDHAVASVMYYGMPEQDVEKLKSLQAPVLGIFAEKDQWINRDVVSKYESAMDKAGKDYETHWFNADHAFANPSNAIFDADATRKAKEKTVAFLSARMVR